MIADTLTAIDLFSGAGGSSQGIEFAGVPVWYAANHSAYALGLHENYFRNILGRTNVEHFVADLVDEGAKSYIKPEDLPRAGLCWASPSCVNHSKANSQKAYREQVSLFDMVDPEYEERVTHSERSRATAVCVLRYVARHMPLVVGVENVVQFSNWGSRLPGKNTGDGTTFRWWLGEFAKLGYKHKILWLNSQFFGAPQSRDRMYVAFWRSGVATPDLEHRPHAWCGRCDEVIEAHQAWKPRKASWPLERWGCYGAQYIYACPACGARVEPPTSPAYQAIDWSDLGTRIGDRAELGMIPLAPRTTERIERGLAKFADCPSLIIPCQGDPSFSAERPVTHPLTTQTGRQDKALATKGVIVTAAGNTFERPGSDCRTRCSPSTPPPPTASRTDRSCSPPEAGASPAPTRGTAGRRPSRSPRSSPEAPTSTSPKGHRC